MSMVGFLTGRNWASVTGDIANAMSSRRSMAKWSIFTIDKYIWKIVGISQRGSAGGIGSDLSC